VLIKSRQRQTLCPKYREKDTSLHYSHYRGVFRIIGLKVDIFGFFNFGLGRKRASHAND